MKEYVIYYNKLHIDYDNKLVTLANDCPNVTHLTDDDNGVFRVSKMFIKTGLWDKWFCPQLGEKEGYDFKFESI
tara:strand:- start:1734 stop:1955 length:222 start_codon:yes stop_codon:yes gene_type:complete